MKLTDRVPTSSKYLKKTDVIPEKTVTIKAFVDEMVDGVQKLACYFENTEKPMIVNSTNAQLIAFALETEDMESMIGKAITLWNDPTVSYQGQRTGGIRVKRAPAMPADRGGHMPPPAQPPELDPRLTPDDVASLQQQVAMAGKRESDLLEWLESGSIYSITQDELPAIRKWLDRQVTADVPQ